MDTRTSKLRTVYGKKQGPDGAVYDAMVRPRAGKRDISMPFDILKGIVPVKMGKSSLKADVATDTRAAGNDAFSFMNQNQFRMERGLKKREGMEKAQPRPTLHNIWGFKIESEGRPR